jgi:hypothetical protein
LLKQSGNLTIVPLVRDMQICALGAFKRTVSPNALLVFGRSFETRRYTVWPRRRRQRKRENLNSSPIVKWRRTAGIAAELLGLGELVLAEWSWPPIGCIYLGFALQAADVWFERDFHQKWEWKASAWAIILLAAAGFSWKIVFVDAPLPVFALMTNGEYQHGTVLAGINWKREFTELDVDIQNPTEGSGLF